MASIYPRKTEIKGYTIFSISIVLSFNQSILPYFCQHFKIFVKNPTKLLTGRQCMFVRKIEAEETVVTELSHFVILTVWCFYYG